jgi:hypothetical protein
MLPGPPQTTTVEISSHEHFPSLKIFSIAAKIPSSGRPEGLMSSVDPDAAASATLHGDKDPSRSRNFFIAQWPNPQMVQRQFFASGKGKLRRNHFHLARRAEICN